MACLAECSPTIRKKTAAAGCNITTRPGGIFAVVFMLCDASFSDVSGGEITDVGTWQTLIEDDKIFFASNIIGSKAVGSPTTLRVSSCQPEIQVGNAETISIRDYGADNVDLTDYDFWADIQANQQTLKFGYVTCDDLVYFFEDKEYSIVVGDVRPETKEEPAHFAATITTNQIGIRVPVKVTGLSSIL